MEEGGEEVECRVGGYVERLGLGVSGSLWNLRGLVGGFFSNAYSNEEMPPTLT